MAEASNDHEAVSKGVEDLDKEITCPVCQEHFEEPKLLPCGHFYCKKCIDALACQSGRGRPFSCPECRKTTRLPQNDSTKLPNAFFVNRMKDIHSLMIKPASDDPKRQPSTEQESKPRKPRKRHSRKSCRDPPAAVPSDHRQPRHRSNSSSSSYDPDRRTPDTTKNRHRSRSSCDSAIHDAGHHWHSHDVVVNPLVRDVSKNRSKPCRVSSKGHQTAIESKVRDSVAAPMPRPKHRSTAHTPHDPPNGRKSWKPAHVPPNGSLTAEPARFTAQKPYNTVQEPIHHSPPRYYLPVEQPIRCSPPRPYLPVEQPIYRSPPRPYFPVEQPTYRSPLRSYFPVEQPAKCVPPQQPSPSSVCKIHGMTVVAYCYDCCRNVCQECISTRIHAFHEIERKRVNDNPSSTMPKTSTKPAVEVN